MSNDQIEALKKTVDVKHHVFTVTTDPYGKIVTRPAYVSARRPAVFDTELQAELFIITSLNLPGYSNKQFFIKPIYSLKTQNNEKAEL